MSKNTDPNTIVNLLLLTPENKVVGIPRVSKDAFYSHEIFSPYAPVFFCENKKYEHIQSKAYQKRKSAILEILKKVNDKDFQTFLQKLETQDILVPKVIVVPKISSETIEEEYLTEELHAAYSQRIMSFKQIEDYDSYLRPALKNYEALAATQQELTDFILSPHIEAQLDMVALKAIYVHKKEDILSAFSLNYKYEEEIKKWCAILEQSPHYFERLKKLRPVNLTHQSIQALYSVESLRPHKDMYVWLFYSDFDKKFSLIGLQVEAQNERAVMLKVQNIGESFGLFLTEETALYAYKSLRGLRIFSSTKEMVSPTARAASGSEILAHYENGYLKKLINPHNSRMGISPERKKIEEELEKTFNQLLEQVQLSQKISALPEEAQPSRPKFKM